MADEMDNGSVGHNFGSCCDELKQVMSGEDFEPLITVGNDNVLYMSVGLIDIDEDEPGMVDHPVFFCPFCGTKIQDADEVREKMDALEES
ncbi:MAG: hypothetical protein RIC14_06500 [Filomicrobium sp.]